MLNKKTKIIILTGVLTVVILALINIIKPFKSKKPAQDEIAARPVTTAPALTGNVPVLIKSFGNLNPTGDVNVKSQVTGQIKAVNFKEGQMVKEGELLFTIDPSSYQAQYEKAKANLDADMADLKLKKDILQRNEKLYQSGLISEQDYVKYKSDLQQIQAKIKVDESDIALAKINLDYCSVKSPIDGLTGKRQIDIGNIVSADTGVLVNIKKIDPLYVDFSVSESQLQNIRDAMAKAKLKVQVTAEDDDKNVFPGEIELLENVVDTKTGTISLRAIVRNQQQKLWPGEFVNVNLILGEENDVVLIPYEAVQLGQQGDYVFVVNSDNKAELRNVTLGQQQDDKIIVKDGVKAGEKVVVTGQMGLSTGVLVKETGVE